MKVTDPETIPLQRVTVPQGGALFFSDVHLGAQQAPPQERLIELLQSHRTAVRSIFILGDLFEFWYGYRTVVFHQFLPLLFTLRDLTRAGIELHYIAGNHDFCLGPVFEEQLGVQTHQGALEVQLGDLRLYLAHGDRIDGGDRGYRLLHALVHSRPIDWLIRMIPPDLGWRLAIWASRRSRNLSSRLDVDHQALFHAFSQKLFERRFDGVILGHSHEPELSWIEYDGRHCLVANTGDWVEHWTSILYQPVEGFRLVWHSRNPEAGARAEVALQGR